MAHQIRKKLTFLNTACRMRVASSHLLSSSSLESGNPPAGAVSSKTISTRFSPESDDRLEELKLLCREDVPEVMLEALLPFAAPVACGSDAGSSNPGISETMRSKCQYKGAIQTELEPGIRSRSMTVSVSGSYRTYGVLGSVIFICSGRFS